MTTLEVEIAVMDWLGIRRNLVVPNVSWGIWRTGLGQLHECDILSLTPSMYATEVEIKVSKYDLLKDKDKEHGHNHPLIATLYYAVPAELEGLARKEIPEMAGLLVVRKVYLADRKEVRYIVKCVKSAKRQHKTSLKWTDEEKMQLARLGAMRILGLKKKLLKK